MKVKGLWTIGLLCERVVVGAGDDELKRRFWGRSLPRCCLFVKKMTSRRAPPCRARITCWWLGLPVLDEPAVGGLDLL